MFTNSIVKVDSVRFTHLFLKILADCIGCLHDIGNGFLSSSKSVDL